MKYSKLVSPQLVLYTIFAPTAVWIIPLVICIGQHKLSLVIVLASFHLFGNLFFLFFTHRAFGRVSFSRCEVSNRYLKLNYEDIQFATIIEVDPFEYRLFPRLHIQMICLSKNKQECSFLSYPKNECIVLPRTKRTLRQLKECSENRSQAICSL